MPSSLDKPFWGEATSYLKYDYIITRYVAEFINTLSSLAFVAYGLYGLSRPSHNGQTRARLLSYSGLIGVGICSASYHMTLKYHTQMSDELSMHFLTTPMVYRLLTFKSSPQRTKLVAVLLTILFTVVMVTHMVMNEFLLHATTFGLAVYLIATRTLKLISLQVPDDRIRKNLRNIALFGCFNFAFGYFVWLLDGWLCSLLTSMKHSAGLPLAFFLELHGWWHIFTCIGGYVGVALVDAITSGVVREDPIHHLAWPVPSAARLLSGANASPKQE
ncbi:alkaline phytoceramidase [Trichoderma asperelloides]|nr:alkaline phytoceramidase [Trichoderma asperelloides]